MTPCFRSTAPRTSNSLRAEPAVNFGAVPATPRIAPPFVRVSWERRPFPIARRAHAITRVARGTGYVSCAAPRGAHRSLSKAAWLKASAASTDAAAEAAPRARKEVATARRCMSVSRREPPLPSTLDSTARSRAMVDVVVRARRRTAAQPLAWRARRPRQFSARTGLLSRASADSNNA